MIANPIPAAVTPRTQRRATTLDVPGLTRSRVSPNGHISQYDVASKLVIVMVGLPARGKSYLTNKLCRYLNWLQYDARIFNVGNTRRKASKTAGPASVPLPDNGPHTSVWNQHEPKQSLHQTTLRGPGGYTGDLHMPSEEDKESQDQSSEATDSSPSGNLEEKEEEQGGTTTESGKKPATEQTADFFSPDNVQSFKLREQWAMDTLDSLLDYVISGPGSIGILDATNTTVARRKKVLRHIKKRSDGQLKVLFVESICSDSRIIEKNIRLKLSGPDYKNSDKEVALNDFIGRMRNYEKVYQTLTEAEAESDSFQYVKMIDVGKKIHTFNIKGFLAPDVVAFLLNFNLAERQIWITRHGESVDNAAGRIGGDSKLTPRGQKFSKALVRFTNYQKEKFRKNQLKQHIENKDFLKAAAAGNELVSSNETDGKDPLMVENEDNKEPEEPSFCVWTSMLRRSIETATYFDEDVYDIKEMRMLNELGAGICDGMTYPEIKATYPHEYRARMADKISYRYPGPGGESYLDVINRIRPIIVEVERMTDNILIIAHRVVCRILLAYFMNLGRDAIGDLDVPLHTLYCLEPKPYGVSWEAYEYDDKTDWFYRVPKETMISRSRLPPKNHQPVARPRQYSVCPTENVPLNAQPASSYAQIQSVMTSMASSQPISSMLNQSADSAPHPDSRSTTPTASFSIGSTPIQRRPSASRSETVPVVPSIAFPGSIMGVMASSASSNQADQYGSSTSKSGAESSVNQDQNSHTSESQKITLPHTPYSTLPPISELSARLNNIRKF